MGIRAHKQQHDSISDLPLVTETATVTAVEAMDRNRREEVRQAIRTALKRRGYGADAEPLSGMEPTAIASWLAEHGSPHLARRIGAIAERYERTRPMLVRAELETEEPIAYLAGQYVGLRYDGTSRAYSLASSPNRDTLEICVRRVQDGRLSPKLCGDLEVGDELTVRGPHGDLVLNEPSPRDVVFLATGTGVAPFKGMIEYLFEEGLDTYRGTERTVWLFLGAAWADDLPYRAAFERLAAEHDNFRFVPTVSREPYLARWNGETDYVQHVLLKHIDPATVTNPLSEPFEAWLGRSPVSGIADRLDPADMEVYACGINAMVHSLVRVVRELGVPEAHIESEGFG